MILNNKTYNYKNKKVIHCSYTCKPYVIRDQ